MDDQKSSMSADINRKYMRAHIKPAAKSVYQRRKAVRMNGSMIGGLRSSGGNLMTEDTKDLVNISH